MPYKDPAKNAACKKAYVIKNRGKHRAATNAWAQRNPEKKLRYAKTYRDTHQAKAQKATAEWRKKNAGYVQIYEKNYRTVKSEQINIKNGRRRAFLAQAPINDLTLDQWIKIKEYYGYRCIYCRKKQERLTQDHIIPLTKGGEHSVSNVVPACQSCNSKKGVKPPPIPVQPLLCI